VFYLSTFSKTFAPGFRVGWVLAPHAVREKLVIASEAQILCPSAFAQAAVSAYLSTMPWREQLKSYREIYRERRDALLESLAGQMPAGTGWTRPGGGLFVWATLPGGLDAKAMVPRALGARVAYVPGTGFYADGGGTGNLRLNFSFSAPDRIREGIRRLAGVVEQELSLRSVFGAVPPSPTRDAPASLLDVAETGAPAEEGP
jgi:DNA-binding transcriptional MocR family regulator